MPEREEQMETSLREETHFDGRRMMCFAGRPAGLHALFADAVAANPKGEAVVCGEERLTYEQLDDLIGRIAGGLAQAGVGKGDRVALLIGNRIEFEAVVFAAARLGAIWVPLNVRDQSHGMRHMLVDSGAKVLVADAALADRVPAPSETPALTHRFIVAGQADGFRLFSDLVSAVPIRAPVESSEGDVAAIFYTSGTTGLPKGATLTNLGFVHSALHYQTAMSLGSADRSLACVPLGHVTGSVAMLATIVRAAGTLVLMETFRAADFLRLAAKERVTHTVMVPAQYNLCLLQADRADHDLSAWRIGGFGGAQMPAITVGRIADWLPGLNLMNLYGATETTSPAVIMPSEHIAGRPDSVGRPVLCASIRVVDDEGNDVPAGTAGEVWIAGPMVVPGYWGNDKATAESFTDGYWHSGDVGSFDEEGFLRVFDRKKDVINRGGFKIYSAEVENVLTADENVSEAAVVGKFCPVLGERVHAFLVPKEGRVPDVEAITAKCREELTDYKVPESYTVLDRPLPRNANGKVLKRQLRDEFLAGEGPSA